MGAVPREVMRGVPREEMEVVLREVTVVYPQEEMEVVLGREVAAVFPLLESEVKRLGVCLQPRGDYAR